MADNRCSAIPLAIWDDNPGVDADHAVFVVVRFLLCGSTVNTLLHCDSKLMCGSLPYCGMSKTTFGAVPMLDLSLLQSLQLLLFLQAATLCLSQFVVLFVLVDTTYRAAFKMSCSLSHRLII